MHLSTRAAVWLHTAVETLVHRVAWHRDDGFGQAAEAAAIGAAGVMAIVALFAVFQERATGLLNALFDQLMP